MCQEQADERLTRETAYKLMLKSSISTLRAASPAVPACGETAECIQRTIAAIEECDGSHEELHQILHAS